MEVAREEVCVSHSLWVHTGDPFYRSGVWVSGDQGGDHVFALQRTGRPIAVAAQPFENSLRNPQMTSTADSSAMVYGHQWSQSARR